MLKPSVRALAALMLLVVLLAPGPAAAFTNRALKPIGPLKACTFTTENDTASTENIKLSASGASGIKGTLTFSGLGLEQTVSFKLDKNGLALTSFPVSTSGPATITVTLATKPPKKRTLHVALQAAGSLAQQITCTPK